jgi:hypothetical protein
MQQTLHFLYLHSPSISFLKFSTEWNRTMVRGEDGGHRQ